MAFRRMMAFRRTWTTIFHFDLRGKADADTRDCGTAVSQCSEYLTF
jgi:hypothetical protein